MTNQSMRGTMLLAGVVLTAAVLAGCGGQDVPINYEEELDLRAERISELEDDSREYQAKLEARQQELAAATLRAREAEAAALAGSAAGASDASEIDAVLLPPDAEAGECFARVLVPPVYETTTERVLVKDASSEIEIVAAQFKWGEQEVLVKEASEKLIVVPATYRKVEEKILVKPASKRIIEVPAVYETVTEKMLVTPAREYWKKGRGPIEKVDGATGEIMCLIKEDAVYKNVSKKILKSKATTREESIPAEYKTIKRTVIDRPAATRTEVIPAEYATIKVREQVTPASEKHIPVEAEYRTVTKRAMVEPSYLEWRQVLCETNMTQSTVLDVQKALKAKGFDPGPVDGVYGTQTQSAVNAFQDAKGLPRGALTFGTVKALGLSY